MKFLQSISILALAVSIITAQDFCSTTEHSGESVTETDINVGSIGDIGYEIWYQGGENSATFYEDGSFSCSFKKSKDYLCRSGLSFDNTQTHEEIGHLYADFKLVKQDIEDVDYSYIGIYGWSREPLIEYYVVDNWLSQYRPGDWVGEKKHGDFMIDGAEYTVYENTRYGPSIDGETTFTQFFSIRKEARDCGTIDITAHFKKWEELGMVLGKLHEAKVLGEAGSISDGTSGTADFPYAKVYIGEPDDESDDDEVEVDDTDVNEVEDDDSSEEEIEVDDSNVSEQVDDDESSEEEETIVPTSEPTQTEEPVVEEPTQAQEQPIENKDVIKIMPIGDSITFGWGEDGGYRKYLYNILKDNGYDNIDFVGPEGSDSATFEKDGKTITYDDNHSGFSGFTIMQQPDSWSDDSGLYEKLKSLDAVKKANPDIVLLIIGTNDMTANRSMEDCEADLHTLLDYILGDISSESIIIMGTIPEFRAYGGNEERVANYNRTVKKVAEDYANNGSNVKFADVHGCLNGMDDIDEDDLHPTGEGYEKMAKFWFSQLEQYLEPTSAAVATTAEDPVDGCASIWEQCGGEGFNGPSCCSEGSCVEVDRFFSQCQRD